MGFSFAGMNFIIKMLKKMQKHGIFKKILVLIPKLKVMKKNKKKSRLRRLGPKENQLNYSKF